MLSRRDALVGMGLAPVGTLNIPHASAAPDTSEDVVSLRSATFAVDVDRQSGALTGLAHPADPSAMNWVSEQRNAPWLPSGSRWGLGYADLGPSALHRSRWGAPLTLRQDSTASITAIYHVGSLVVEVTRTLVDDALEERFTFRNTGAASIPMRGRGKASLGIYTPCNDHYTSAADVLEHRCHAHIWTGGASSWIAMLRMGGRAPHLGLVLTQGALDGYSEDRDQVTLSNTRGSLLVHPVIEALAPGMSTTIAWTMFWHTGWDDFFNHALRRSPQMVRIQASASTAFPGETTRLLLQGQLGPSPSLKLGDLHVPLRRAVGGWEADVLASVVGEQMIRLEYGNGLATHGVLNTSLPVDELLRDRTAFIAARQQWRKPGDPWDGAYLVFDNEADVPARWERSSDRNSGRERVGMGVLLARWLAASGDRQPALRSSLNRYYQFVCEHLQSEDGAVFDDADQPRKRLYNWPWVMQLHLAMARLTGQAAPLDRFVKTTESFYREGGTDFYPIGLPVLAGLDALSRAGRAIDHDRLAGLFARHGERLMERGIRYPASEVNYEQSIVAPAALVLLELHLATGDPKWLAGAAPHLALLELFEGRQPDHHLHGIAIRHWDGYWFGKARMWGDTFSHYWSSLNALAWQMRSIATGDYQWEARARTTLRNNLSLFRAGGRASAAFLYPTTVNGRPAHVADAYANDQDWALVHVLDMEDLRRRRTIAPSDHTAWRSTL